MAEKSTFHFLADKGTSSPTVQKTFLLTGTTGTVSSNKEPAREDNASPSTQRPVQDVVVIWPDPPPPPSATSLLPCINLESSSHSVNMNVDASNHIITFAGDKRFGLVFLEPPGIKGKTPVIKTQKRDEILPPSSPPSTEFFRCLQYSDKSLKCGEI
jgi:hypothetical protein